MGARYYDLHGIRVAELAAEGAPLRSGRDAVDAISEAAEHDPEMIVIPTQRFDEDFFRLRTGVAGEILQKFLTYGLRLAIVGDVAERAQKSPAFRDLVYECNRGSEVWFVAHVDELGDRLQQTNAR